MNYLLSYFIKIVSFCQGIIHIISIMSYVIESFSLQYTKNVASYNNTLHQKLLIHILYSQIQWLRNMIWTGTIKNTSLTVII